MMGLALRGAKVRTPQADNMTTKALKCRGLWRNPMKIGHTPELPGAVQPSVPAKQAPAAVTVAEEFAKGAPAVSAAGVPVTVTLSRTARDIEPPGRATAEFDANRVKAMRAAIENGTFRFNPEAVADKLLSNARDFLSLSVR